MTRRARVVRTTRITTNTAAELDELAKVSGLTVAELLRLAALRMIADWKGSARDHRRWAALARELKELRRTGYDTRELTAIEGDPPLPELDLPEA